MLATLVRKELLAHVLSLRFIAGAIFTLVLFVASALVLTADYRGRVEAYQAASAAHRKSTTEARVFSEVRIEADRAPAPLSVLCQGVDRSLPASSAFSIMDPPTLDGAGAARNPLLVVFPGLDLAIVVQVVMSLLALLFAHDTISGERARGTLPLTLANRLPRSTVLAGKYVGGMAVLLPLLGLGMGASLVLVAGSPLVHFAAADWAATGVIFAVSAAYLSLVFLLGMVISVVTPRPGTSLVAGLFAWVVLVLLAPPAASALAATIHPLPSARARAAAEEHANNAFYSAMIDYARSHRLPLSYEQQRFNVDRQSLQSGGVPLLGKLYSAPREYVEWALAGTRHALPLRLEAAAKIQEIRREAVRRMTSQARLARLLRLVSPAAGYADAVTLVAGTDEGRYVRFREAVERYREAFLGYARAKEGLDWRFFTREAALHMPPLAELERLEAAGDRARLKAILGEGFASSPPLDLAGMPAFALPRRPLGARLAAAAPQLAALALLSLLLLLIAALAFARADVRVR